MIIFPTANHGQFELEQQADDIIIRQDNQVILQAKIAAVQANLSIIECQGEQLLAACYALFSTYSLTEITRSGPTASNVTSDLLWQKIDSNLWQLDSRALNQYAPLWLAPNLPTWYPQVQVLDDKGSYHPQRPAQDSLGNLGVLYRRFDPSINAWISLSALDIEQHAQLFSDWQNNPRVAAFWDQTGTLAEHTAYLHELQKDPKVLPLIACINDEPFAYFEAYWTKEDRIAPYFDVQDFDRGIHMLVGNEQHRGPHKVQAWLSALCHFLFLNDARTNRIVSEPRADNQRMINYMQGQDFVRLKEFNFPHKRAALMLLMRDAFFEKTNNYTNGDIK
ncbi:MAG: acetyltransferase [Oleispira sp.]|nr:acetyltransferase [Oleispira sp.]